MNGTPLLMNGSREGATRSVVPAKMFRCPAKLSGCERARVVADMTARPIFTENIGNARADDGGGRVAQALLNRELNEDRPVARAVGHQQNNNATQTTPRKQNRPMKTFVNQNIPDQLHNARLLIENTQASAAILAIMLKFGYTAADFTAAHVIYQKALDASKLAAAEGGSAELGTADFQKAMATARGRFADFGRIARGIFKGDKPSISALGLDKRRPRAIAKFIDAAEKLYDLSKLTPAMTQKIKKRCDDQWLSEARGEVGQLKVARNLQKSLDGGAQDATAAQTAALNSLVEWCVEYIAVARVALKKTPQTLEKLGIAVRNNRSKAQIQGVRKAAVTRKLNREKKAAALHKAA